MKGNSKKPIQPLHVKGRTENPGDYIWRFGTLEQELRYLFHFNANPKLIGKFIVLAIGMLLTPISIVGLLCGYNWGYLKFLYPKDELPRLHTLPRIIKISMAIGLIMAWVTAFTMLVLLKSLVGPKLGDLSFIMTYLVFNTIVSIIAYMIWRKWRIGITNMLLVTDAKGSAKWADDTDMAEYIGTEGLYIGGQYRVKHKCHVGLFAATRGGKLVEILINVILGVGGHKTSQIILDPKGEMYAITAAALKRMGKKVVCINPFRVLPDHIKDFHAYNPLSFLSDKSNPNIVDDIATLAEGIIPKVADDRNVFFTNSARAMISTIMLHLVCASTEGMPTLKDLWEKLRLDGEEWDAFLLEMSKSKDPVHGQTIKRGASQIAKFMIAEEMFSSIISTALTATDLFQSKAMQDALESGFDPYELAKDTNTVVFIIIPADKLSSHSAYLRVVISSMLQAVVRKPGERVTLIADEAASLGYMSIIENGLSVFAGFNLSLMLVYQDFAQLRAIFKDRFESVLANMYVKIAFSLRDNFSLKYISEALGTKTHVMYKRDFFGNISDATYEARALATPDEVKRISKNEIILLTGENPAARVPRQPYWNNPALHINDKPIYDANPYHENSK